MNSFVIIGILLWFYVLSILKRGRIHFWYFCVGSIGVFIFSLIIVQPLLLEPLTKVVTALSGGLGQMTKLYTSYMEYGMLFINRGNTSISLYIDFECAGLIEILAFSSLLWFFPAYKFGEKIMVNLLGTMVIVGANVLRIFAIAITIYYGGNNAYYVAHTIVGRLIFYGCSIWLYYKVFTKTQIKRQQVGDVKYDRE